MNKEEEQSRREREVNDPGDMHHNVAVEIMRLNTKFDIFMKRFMRAEDDIKEVK
jgi:hypothetical protein